MSSDTEQQADAELREHNAKTIRQTQALMQTLYVRIDEMPVLSKRPAEDFPEFETFE